MRFTSSMVVAFLLASLLLAACGSDATPTPTRAPATPTPTPAPTPTLAPGEPTPTPGPALAPTPTLAPTATPEPSFDAEAYFKGKTIRMVVGLAPGGGTDTQARYYAANFRRFIPGNPRIVVTNHTPQIAASNFVWNSEPSGLVIQYTAGTLITDSFEPEADFSASEFSIIGAPQSGNPVWAIRGNLPYQDIRDAMGNPDGEPLIQTGPGSAPEVNGTPLATMLLADWLNIPIEYKVIAGTGTEQTLLMMERGDVNAMTMSPGSTWYTLPARRPGWFADEFLRPFAGLLVPGQEIFANAEIEFTAPNGRDLLNPEQQAIFDSLTPPNTVALKHLAGPPNVDPSVLAALRQAWDDAVADPEFNAGLARVLGSDVSAVPGARLQQMYTSVVDGYRENLDTLTELQERLFSKYIE